MIKTKKSLRLIPIIILLIFTMIYMSYQKDIEKNEYYDLQVLAAEKMDELMKTIKSYKIAKGIPIYEYDYFKTGLVGDEYNEYTTSLGNLEAKRTTANPDMAALIIKMFKQVGLKKGDSIAVGFSGSFPAMNLAVLSASEVMDLDLKIISSFGSSTYGANQIDLTFPEMLDKLNKDEYTRYNSGIVTLGGDNDVASEKDKNIIDEIVDKYNNLGLNVFIEPDFTTNINEKIEFYNSDDEIKCYIAVGGNISFIGLKEQDLANKQGILKNSKIRREKYQAEEGIIQYFLKENIPAIHILNIKKIVLDYGLEFDPVKLVDIGNSNIYYSIKYPKIIPTINIIIAFMYLLYLRKDKSDI